jgi:Putative T7SS secretion signal domain
VQQVRQQVAAATAAGVPATTPDIPFIDPGEKMRQAARDMLDHARGQLASAGDTAAAIVGKARDSFHIPRLFTDCSCQSWPWTTPMFAPCLLGCRVTIWQ